MSLITTPEIAQELLNTIWFGMCRYCKQGYITCKNGMLRKHGNCPKDYPIATYVQYKSSGFEWISLDELAEIALVERKKRYEQNTHDFYELLLNSMIPF